MRLKTLQLSFSSVQEQQQAIVLHLKKNNNQMLFNNIFVLRQRLSNRLQLESVEVYV